MEDTTVPPEVIAEKFGHDAMILVQGVTKLSKLEFRTRHDAQAENLRKMFMAMSSDIRIILIKLADRLHNMRTINGHHSQLRQKEIAEETLSIYAPLAHRLGIFKIKSELEDLSIEVLEPERIADLKPVSYTHLDVYKRQAYLLARHSSAGKLPAAAPL